MSTTVNAGMFTLLSVSTFKERLEEAARDKGVTVTQARADLAKLLGGTRSNMTHWWTGRTKEPKGGAVAVAANYFGVSPLWLAREQGEKRPGEAKGNASVPRRFEGLNEGEIEGILSMYFEMEPETRDVARRQWSDLLELTGKPSPKNPFGKGKKKSARKRRPIGRRRTGNA